MDGEKAERKAGQKGEEIKMRLKWNKMSAEYRKEKKVTQREKCDNQRLNLERQRTKNERDRGVEQRRTVAVTAAAQNSPTGHHRPVLQMSAQSGPPWDASKTPWDLQESR